EITLSEPPDKAGWDWYFVETGALNVSVSLTAPFLADWFGGRSGQTFTVYVKAPYDAARDTKIPIILKGVSKNSNGTLTRTDELIMIVGERNGLSMFAYKDHLEMGPNQTAEFIIGITNTGNIDLIYVLLSVEGRRSGWSFKFPEGPIPLYRDQTKLIPVRIRAPSWTLEEGEMTFSMIGFLEHPSINARVNLTIMIPRISGWTAYIQPLIENVLDPGDSLNASLRMYSWSNFNETIRFTRIDNDDSLEIEITEKEGIPVDALLLEADSGYELVVRINASKDAVAGTHAFTIRLTPVENRIIEISATVNVTQYGDLHATFLDGSLEISDIAPIRERRTYTIEVTNNGNGPDNVSLSLGKFFYRDPLVKVSLDYGWHAEFRGVSLSRESDLETVMVENPFQQVPMELEEGKYYKLRTMAEARYPYHGFHFFLGSGDTAYIDVEVRGDSEYGSEIVDDIDLEFLVTSGVWGGKIFLSLELELLYPDIAFEPLVYSLYDGRGEPVEKVRPNRELFLVVKVINIGETASDITAIDVYVSGEFWSRKDLGPLEPFETREVVIPLSSKNTALVIVLYLDPDNTVHESRDQFTESHFGHNNRMSLGFELEKDEEDRSPLPYIVGAVIGSTILLLMILIVLVYFRRRSSAMDDDFWKPTRSPGREKIGPKGGDGKLLPHNESVQ
ncbi:MAG: CARDB domain-containing protein, partial [Thermoplasmatota archaeon]